MIDGPQPLAKLVGSEGCYALVCTKIAEKIAGRPFPILESVAHARRLGFIDETCTVDASRYISDLVGEPYEVLKAGDGLKSDGKPYDLPLDYILKPGEYESLRFERQNPAGGDPLPHFVEGAGDGKTVSWDPWPNSLTVQFGKLVSRRIVRRKV
jgi:hypothetical protein